MSDTEYKHPIPPLNDIDHLIAVWFVGNNKEDWMCMAWRDTKGIQCAYRFRYYNPDSQDPHDGKDKKSWYKASGPLIAERKLISSIDTIAKMCELRYGTTVSKVVINGPGVRLLDLNIPWMHFQTMPKSYGDGDDSDNRQTWDSKRTVS